MVAPLQATDGRFVTVRGKRDGSEGDGYEGSKWRIYRSTAAKTYYRVPPQFAEFIVQVEWYTLSGMFNSSMQMSSTTIHLPDGTSFESPWHGHTSEMMLAIEFAVAKLWRKLVG